MSKEIFTVDSVFQMIKEKKISADQGYHLLQEHKEAGSRSRQPLKGQNIGKEHLLRLETVRAMKKICSTLFGIEVQKIEETVDFDEYGIDSVMVNEFNQELEKIVPGISKIVLFEKKNINELADFLIEEYEEVLSGKFGTKHTNLPLTEAGIPQGENKWENLVSIKQSEIKKREKNYEDDIAIVGVSGKYPKADDLEQFWDNLKNERDCISVVPEERWDYRPYIDEAYHDVKEGKMYAVWGGFVNDADKFDPMFFNMSPMEAEILDPQERMFLEITWNALEDAGYTRKQLRRYLNQSDSADVGVFVGTTSQTYHLWGVEELVKGNPVLPNASPWSLANRISYLFNFTGPSVPVDTACSSGLTAVHMACESIKRGECSAAIAGGVNLFLHPLKFITMCQMKMLSPTGKCASFGNDADGFVPGEGVGALLLKPLKDAVNDRDHIYGVIKGTGINHDGKTNGYTVPNPNAQSKLIKEVLLKSRVAPESVSYLEAHGTGTKLGDPIEVEAASKALLENSSRRQFCAIGSVKSNIGHLESAAGIASITKVLLMMKHKKLVPSIHSDEMNENIDFERSAFYVSKSFTQWEKPIIGGITCKRRAGISSFGAGGSNAHIILEEYEEPSRAFRDGIQIIVLSAKDKERLSVYIDTLHRFMIKNQDLKLADIAYTLQIGREAMEERAAFLCDSISDLTEKLGRLVKDFSILDADSKNTGEMDGIRQQWLSGKEIDWAVLHAEDNAKRISLPVYPFRQKSYFVKLSPSKFEMSEKHRKIEDEILRRRETAQNKLQRQLEDNILFLPCWVDAERLSENEGKKTGNNLIVYTKQSEEFADILAGKLGRENCTCVILNGDSACCHAPWEDVVNMPAAVHMGFPDLHGSDCIYYLGGIQKEQYSLYDMQALETVQKHASIWFFRLMKELEKDNMLTEALKIKIITNNVFSFLESETTMPFASGINGFMKSFVKEYPFLSAAYIDIDAAEWEQKKTEIVDTVILEETSQDVKELLYRKGRRFVQKLEPRGLAVTDGKPLKENGVYFIVGGLGSIGYEFAKYARVEADAKIAFIGRSGFDENKRSMMDKLGAAEEQVLYIQADCTDYESIHNAVHTVIEKWGHIDGVIHSAMVFEPKLFRNLTEKEYMASLESKVRGSAALAKSLQDIKLDFMMYFSSAQAYMGSKQRVHYTAACTFVEAFAGQQRREASYPVYIINWGFWGTDKGNKITKEYEQFLEKRKIKAISSELGMEIVKRILVNRAKQTVVLTVDESILERIGVLKQPVFHAEDAYEEMSSALQDVIQPQQMPLDKEDQIEYEVTSCIADILKMDQEDIGRNVPFMEMGVDSILGSKLIHRINDVLNLELSETVLFDYTNVEELIRHIIHVSSRKADVPPIAEFLDFELQAGNEDVVFELFKKLEERQITTEDMEQLLEV